jgi:hypothetical protein
MIVMLTTYRDLLSCVVMEFNPTLLHSFSLHTVSTFFMQPLFKLILSRDNYCWTIIIISKTSQEEAFFNLLWSYHTTLVIAFYYCLDIDFLSLNILIQVENLFKLIVLLFNRGQETHVSQCDKRNTFLS